MSTLEFHTHKSGRKVYRVYKDGDWAEGRLLNFIFSFKDDGQDDMSVFDVRRLPTWEGSGDVFIAGGFGPISPEGDKIHAAIEAAIDQGYIP